jgi:hypothetical protein
MIARINHAASRTARLNLSARRLARQAAGAHTNCPVEIVAGNTSPHVTGESYHWTTRTGIRVRHPSAYARVGWSSLVYCSSSLAVQVGLDWILARLPEFGAALQIGAGI